MRNCVASAFYTNHHVNTTVYIDGFNLYYGSLKRTSFKWLDLNKLCRLLLPDNQINKIKYFTAFVKSRPDDLNMPIRQQVYLRALRTLPNIEIIPGHFLSHGVIMPRARVYYDKGSRHFAPLIKKGKQQLVPVIKTEEKGSDVNIATHLINDGHKGVFEAAVLVTNDSDLKEPVRIVHNELKLTIGIISPFETASRSLVQYASFVKTIRKGVLRESQFPDILKDSNGDFHKPSEW